MVQRIKETKKGEYCAATQTPPQAIRGGLEPKTISEHKKLAVQAP